MKMVGILLSLLVSVFIVYLSLQAYRQHESPDKDPLGLTRPLEKAKEVQTTVNLSVVQQAVQAYQIQQGAYPGSLDELVTGGHLSAELIQGLDYDPATGRVSKK